MAAPSLDDQCRRITSSIVAQREYATVDAVVRTLCGWHRVHHLEQLGASITSVPALSLLWHIEQSVAAYAVAFMATHGIACFKDFESEVVGSLRSTCTASLLGMPLAADGFDGYLVGPLAMHPAVRCMWQPSQPSSLIGYHDAALHLVAFLSRQRPRLDVDVAAFGQFLAGETGTSLHELGVVLVPEALPAVVHALRHASHAVAELEVGAARLALEHAQAGERELQQQRLQLRQHRRAPPGGSSGGPDGDSTGDSGRGGGTNMGEDLRSSGAVPELATPHEAPIARVLARCREIVGSSFCPTFTATRAAVEMMAAMPASKKRRRGRAGGVGGGGDEAGGWEGGDGGGGEGAPLLDRETALLVTTEYLMLHLGKPRWRARKWAWQPTGEAAAADAKANASSSSEASSSDEDDEGEDDADQNDGADRKERAVEEEEGPAEAGEDDNDGDEAAADKAPAAKRRRFRRRKEASSDDAQAVSCAPAAVAAASAAAAASSLGDEEIDIDDDDTAAAPLQGATSAAPPASSTVVEVSVRPSGGNDGSGGRLPLRLGVRGSGSGSGGGGGAAATTSVRVAPSSAVCPWRGSLPCSPLDVSNRPAVGRWGEALVYNYLRATLPPERCATWLNEESETKAPYDLTISARGQAAHRGGGSGGAVSVFVEVKTTRHRDANVFDLSYYEWEFLSREPPVRYHIYHVRGAGDPAGATITVIEDPLQAVKDGAIRLCLAV